MCIGESPSIAWPYFITGIFFLIASILYFVLSIIKKWKKKSTKILRIVLVILSLFLLAKSFIEYIFIPRCA